MFYNPHSFFKKILQSPPSVQYWTKSNQIWCVSRSHGWGVQQQKKIALPSGERPKGLSLCLSVRLSPPKSLDEIQPYFVCELLTYMEHTTAQFFWPRPLGSWGEEKRSNIIKFQLQSQFQRFSNQTLCVFSQMKIYNISDGIFIRSPGSCPRGGTL